jgi:putative transcriptional regulator
VSSKDEVSDEAHRIVCHLDRLLAERQMTLTALADGVGVTVVNLSVLKNDRAKAVRFSTLTRICDVLDCHPGDVFSLARPSDPATTPDHQASGVPTRPLTARSSDG